MKTVLDNFERWIRAGNGAAMANQMHRLSKAAKQGIISEFELDQIKAAVRIINWTVDNERTLEGKS